MTDEQKMQSMTRRSLLWAGISVFSTGAIIRWLVTQSTENGTPWVFRRVQETNHKIARTVFDYKSPVRKFAQSDIRPLRVNGRYGVKTPVDFSTWTLEYEGKTLSLEEIKKLPRQEMITEFCCVEGWRTVQKWAGVRFSDFLKGYPSKLGQTAYVGLETPDKEYFVGIDMESMLHPDTLLAYERDGEPLEDKHGGPLRLVIPTKYGYKNLKRIGRIFLSDSPPPDYWANEGYDYFGSL